jgi:hypothetical protein
MCASRAGTQVKPLSARAGKVEAGSPSRHQRTEAHIAVKLQVEYTMGAK